MVLLGRVDGSIYTKAADVGVDLVVKLRRLSPRIHLRTQASLRIMWATK